jgi:Short C-terminal domain/Bacterial PH domain
LAAQRFYFWTVGLYHFWRKAKVFAVTDQRILTTKGIVSKTERSLPLSYVQDASINGTFGAGNVAVSTAGTHNQLDKIGPLKSEEARRFVDAILAHARGHSRAAEPSSASEAAEVAPEDDAYAKLQKLSELHDSGVLSDEEFESKKAELLGRL